MRPTPSAVLLCLCAASLSSNESLSRCPDNLHDVFDIELQFSTFEGKSIAGAAASATDPALMTRRFGRLARNRPSPRIFLPSSNKNSLTSITQ
jgi:hypothetical protein